jgi:CubicO group peptidase (beta-lactamase class C family)
MTQTRYSQFKEEIKNLFEDKKGGVSVAIVDNEDTEFFNYGPESGKHSVYEIASITKVFTALLLVILEEQGVISNDKRIGDILTDITYQDPNVSDITLQELATHTSGLPRLPSNLEFADIKNPYADYREKDLLEFLSGHQLDVDSKGEAHYSNLGYGILGYILEVVSNKSFLGLLHENIFKPVGMHNTTVNLVNDPPSIPALDGYDKEGSSVPAWQHQNITVGAGGILSSTYDMSLFLRTQIGLRESDLRRTIERTHIPFVVNDEHEVKHGFGWIVDQSETGHEVLWHNGGTGGFKSFIGFNKEESIGVIALANTKVDVDKTGIWFLTGKS